MGRGESAAGRDRDPKEGILKVLGRPQLIRGHRLFPGAVRQMEFSSLAAIEKLFLEEYLASMMLM